MKNTLIVTSSNRQMELATTRSIHACVVRGARRLEQTGSADVVFARNAALSDACRALRSVAATASPIDVVLMVDDDMEFAAEGAEHLVEQARVRGRACSAVYVTINQLPAAHAWKKGPDGKQLWLVGLGLVAIPAWRLLDLESTAKPYKSRSNANGQKVDLEYREFCWSGVESGLWKSEDFTLCERLGGVHLLPIEAGHRKTITLWPPLTFLEKLREADS